MKRYINGGSLAEALKLCSKMLKALKEEVKDDN